VPTAFIGKVNARIHVFTWSNIMTRGGTVVKSIAA